MYSEWSNRAGEWGGPVWFLCSAKAIAGCITTRDRSPYLRLLEREFVLAGEDLLAAGEALLDTAGDAFLDVAGEFLSDDAGEALLDDVATPFFFTSVSSFFYSVRNPCKAEV